MRPSKILCLTAALSIVTLLVTIYLSQKCARELQERGTYDQTILLLNSAALHRAYITDLVCSSGSLTFALIYFSDLPDNVETDYLPDLINSDCFAEVHLFVINLLDYRLTVKPAGGGLITLTIEDALGQLNIIVTRTVWSVGYAVL